MLPNRKIGVQFKAKANEKAFQQHCNPSTDNIWLAWEMSGTWAEIPQQDG